jgi:hypothetical protein
VLILFIAETAARAAAVIGMELPDDLNQDAGLTVIRGGKGGKSRVVPYSPQCATMIDAIFGCGESTGWPGRAARGYGSGQIAGSSITPACIAQAPRLYQPTAGNP